MKIVPMTTGIGSMPGDDTLSAARWVSDLWSLPHLPEMPGRGPWTAMIGRTSSLLIDLPVDLQPRGWRLVDRPGQDLRRAQRFLAGDVDALEEALVGYQGPVKIQVAGPWTMIANLFTQKDRPVLIDSSACRDLAQSLAAGLGEQIARMSAIEGITHVIVQIDEPSISGVLNGAGGTLLSAPRVPEESEVQMLWQFLIDAVHDAGGVAMLHTCADQPPLSLASAFDALSTPITIGAEAIAPWLDQDKSLILGVIPSVDTALPSVATTVSAVKSLMADAGFADRMDLLSFTAECGFPAASVGYIKEASKHCKQVLQEFA